MHKPAKYFLAVVFFLIGGLTLLLLYYGGAGTKESAVQTPDAARQIVDPQKLEEDYRAKTKAIVAEFVSAAEVPSAEGANLADKVKTELFGLTVPPKFKDLHAELFFAAGKLLDSLKNGNETKKLESLATIKQAKNKYDWLN